MAEPGLFEIIHSTRAMRRLKPDPVPDELIREVLRAGTAAPSGGNTQPWHFLVLRDPEPKREVQRYYQRAFDEFMLPYYQKRIAAMPPGADRDKVERTTDATQHLTEHFHEAPVWIVACLAGLEKGRPERITGASIYPAVQNMLLACRALGLGATLTTRHTAYAAEVDKALGLPDDVRSYAILPIGYPVGRFGPVRRKPLSEVAHADRWGNPFPDA